MSMIYFYFNTSDGHLIIVSVTYYNKSSFYLPSTAVLLFNAKHNIKINQKWKCVSEDIHGNALMSETMPRFAYPIIPDCAWTTFIANCSTIVNPIKFQLSVDNVAIDLQLRPAVTETLPVVACFSPLFFNERWQLAAISIESYAAAGISRQIYYLMSAVKDVYDLLKLYEKEKLIDINLWSLPKHSEARIHLDWRNQAAAHTDCYLQYREAAQFIIISDIDDLLFPRKEFSFINELQFFSSLYQNASSFFYPRFDAEIVAAKTFKNFNIQASLKSIKISDKLVTGKSVHKTALVETAWLHWAGITKNKNYFKMMDMAENIFVHIRNWKFIEKHYNNNKSLNSVSKIHKNPLFPNIAATAPVNYISLLTHRFNKRFLKKPEIHHIQSTAVYYNKIDECYNEMQLSIKKHYQKHKEAFLFCPTPARCKFLPVPNFSCAVTSAHYRTTKLTDNFFVDKEILKSKIVIRKNGCKIN